MSKAFSGVLWKRADTLVISPFCGIRFVKLWIGFVKLWVVCRG